MYAYITRRLLLIIPTIFLVTIIVFFLVRFIPGDVIKMMVAEIAQQATNPITTARVNLVHKKRSAPAAANNP